MPRRHLNTISLQILIFFSLACTSTTDKAKELQEAGLYADAVEMYQKALKEDPDDYEAKIGLAKSQQELVSKGLIEVRMLRMANSFRIAAEKLEDILLKESKWNVKYNSGVSITQATEVGYISKWLAKEISKSASQGRADEARWYSKRFKKIMQAASLRVDSKSQEQMSKDGKKLCKSLQKLARRNSHFFVDFAQTYCNSWGVSWSFKLDNDNSRYQRMELKNRLRVSQNADSPISTQTLSSEMEKVFQGSPWFSSQSTQVLQASLKGTIKYKRWGIQATKVAKYKEKVKDEDTKKTKTVEKNYRYKVTQHSERIKLNINSEFDILNTPIKRTLDEQFTHRTESTKARFLPAGISPSAPRFMDLDSWLNKHYRKLIMQQSKALIDLWSDHYCNMTKVELSQSELILRCAATKRNHTKVETWFKSQFKLSHDDYLISIR